MGANTAWKLEIPAVHFQLNQIRKWTIGIPGGGWCSDEISCLFRANSSCLGKDCTAEGTGPHNACDGGSDDNCISLAYCDGSSFTSFRTAAWPVPQAPQKVVFFRGVRNMMATLDWAFANGMGNATEVHIGGASAGGLSTYLHMNRLLDRLAKEAPQAKLLGGPVDGYFLDHDDFSHNGASFSAQNRYMYKMMNMSFGPDGALDPQCKPAFPSQPWKCFMAPHMQRFIRASWFMLQSKFDFWQLGNELALPSSNCVINGGRKGCNDTAAERAAVLQYGVDALQQLQPVIDSAAERKIGGFVTSCICHYHCPYGLGANISARGLSPTQVQRTWYSAVINGTSLSGSFVVDNATRPNGDGTFRTSGYGGGGPFCARWP